MNNTNQTDATVLTPVQQAITAAQAGNKPLARLHLENAVTSEHKNPNYWVWLAWTAESPISTISALQHALSLTPEHPLAKQGLAWALAMRDFDLNNYNEPVAEAAAVPASHETEAQASVESTDDSFGTEALELPAVDTPEEVQVEQTVDETVPAPTTELEETPVAEPTLEVEEVDEPIVLEPVDELAADIETIEELPVEPVEVHDEVSEVNTEHTESASEPLEAEIVDVSDISAEERIATDDNDGDTEAVAPASDGPLTILAVDDSPTIRKIVSMSLEGVGYKVVTAADGMEAMQHLPKCNPSLILTDISMPKIDGYQLCKLVKSHENTKTIPVIMLSGKDGMFDKIKGKFVGCDDYITKPFQSAELLEKVSSYLPAPVSDS